MDSLAVSIASGAVNPGMHWKYKVRLAVVFGMFQGGMPLVGFWAGLLFQETIQTWDHWLAFLLLSGIGLKMVIEAVRPHENQSLDLTNSLLLLTLAIATSIDAMASGLAFTVMTVSIQAAVCTIGMITFSLCLVGPWIGKMFGPLLQNKVTLLGGLLLAGLGTKILLSHTGIIE